MCADQQMACNQIEEGGREEAMSVGGTISTGRRFQAQAELFQPELRIRRVD